MYKTLRRAVILLLAAVMTMAVMTACMAKPCVECGEKAEKAYKVSDGESLYYCDDCASDCMFCGDEAEWVASSAFGNMFVCGDCRDGMNDLFN